MSFQTYWHLVLIISLWCCGFYTISRKGKIFGFIYEWFEHTNKKGDGYAIPHWIANPIVSCIYCLSSVHGLLLFLGYLIYTGQEILNWHNLIVIPIIVSSSPLNGIFWNIAKKLSDSLHD